MTEARDLNVRDLRNLTGVIHDVYGYDFSHYARASFRRRVQRVMDLQRLEGPDHLIHRLRKDRTFFERFLQEITVNTTEMFRDPSFWRNVRDELLPEFRKFGKIRIWHAGCSSGEEVYSMAILLHEAGMLDNAIIYATDIDQGILHQARSGNHAIGHMELNIKNYERFGGAGQLQDYYKEVGDRAIFDQHLIRNVKYKIHNLVAGEQFMKFDLILCRNVMIYFDAELQREVIRLMHASCFHKGYMCLGAKETIQWINSPEAAKFQLVMPKDSIYQKMRD
ncbi:MAG: protein-glutamate O-methyltransferase CheR [Bacteroidota bacterium]